MSHEVWRRIREAPLFAVSTHGRVQNLLTEEIMEEHVDEDGDDEYLGVNLIDRQGNEFCAPIDVLVVEAFVGPVDGLEQIIHYDDDPSNNNIWNLEVDAAFWDCKADDCE
jgi:hypothetical protein